MPPSVSRLVSDTELRVKRVTQTLSEQVKRQNKQEYNDGGDDEEVTSSGYRHLTAVIRGERTQARHRNRNADSEVAKEALRLAAQKLPISTKFVVKRDYIEEA